MRQVGDEHKASLKWTATGISYHRKEVNGDEHWTCRAGGDPQGFLGEHCLVQAAEL